MIDRVAIVGVGQQPSVAVSFFDGALSRGFQTSLIDTSPAYGRSALLRRISWRMLRRHPHQRSFSRALVRKAGTADLFVLIGDAPVTASTVKDLQASGARVVSFSTDDPFNPLHRSQWHWETLQACDGVFTPRRANIADLEALGCRNVEYLPFGFDPKLCEAKGLNPEVDVVFIGGADAHRAELLYALHRHGLSLAIYGGNWERWPKLASAYRGYCAPERLAQVSQKGRLNVCTPKMSNRDGHNMRLFEATATGVCTLTQWTRESEALFGPDGENVAYFSDAQDLVTRARALLAQPVEQRAMAERARDHIRGGGHSYAHRLADIVSRVDEWH